MWHKSQYELYSTSQVRLTLVKFKCKSALLHTARPPGDTLVYLVESVDCGRIFGSAFQGSVARGQLSIYGSIYVERHEYHTFPPLGGGHAPSRRAHRWTPPRREALPRESTSSMCVQPSPKRRGRRCACNSPSPAPPLKEAVALQNSVITPSLSPYLLRLLQLEVTVAAFRSVAALVAVFTRSGHTVCYTRSPLHHFV